MPQDAFTISYLTQELKDILNNAKITKIIQPESDEIALFAYTKFGGKKLVISSSGTAPRCHLTIEEKQNPSLAPSFCMLLRKYLTNGNIVGVTQRYGDRVIVFDIISKNEMQDNESYKLIVELISRSSNIILSDNSYTILGALRKSSLDDNYSRNIMNGAKYEFPEQTKASPTDVDKISIIIKNFSSGKIGDYILENISGLAYSTVKEILNRAKVNFEDDALSEENKNSIINSFDNFSKLKLINDYKPCVAIIDNEVKEFCVTPYFSSYKDFEYFDNLNEAISFYYQTKDAELRIKEHSKQLRDIIKTNINRTEKKLNVQKQQMNDSLDLEQDKICGELITSNIYKIKYGDELVEVDNYYSDPITKIKIKLNKTLSPSSNAQNYYKKYAKKKRTIEFLTEQIIESQAHLSMLNNFMSTLSNITNVDELSLIKEDLINAKIIKEQSKGKKKATKKVLCAQYQFDGYKIYMGRNSTENEYVTHKLGKNKDMWFHAKDGFGSHVLVKYENREFSDELYLFAAELAGYYSEFRNSKKAEIDYTEVKNVKKPPNGKLGLVIYNTNYSITVTPNQHEKNKIK